ncbi:MAG: S8 family peptidase [Thermomicrobiales bacterium]
MSNRISMLGWFVGFCMVLALIPQTAMFANDDDLEVAALAQSDDEDDDVFEPEPADDDDDVFEPEPEPIFDDDDDDESFEPEPIFDEDDEDAVLDDDDEDDGFEIIIDDDDDGIESVIDNRFDTPRPDQAIVDLRDGVDPNAFAQRYNLTVLRVIPTPNIVLFQLDSARDDNQEIVDFLDDDDVEWAELNVTAQAPEGRPRYFFTAVTGVPRLVDGPALPIVLEFTPEVACVTGADVAVAVLDTGVDVNHPDLVSSVLPTGVNMVDNSFDVRDVGNGLDDDADGQIDEMVGHGTHVAGSILQVAPDARILPVKVLNSDGVGDAFMVTSGIHYAVEQGADVINLSLGSTYDSFAIRDAVEFATSQDVVVVAAVGNGDHQEPAEFPAAVDNVLSVASTTADADKAEYSNYHPSVDISAPGNDLASAYPGGLYTTASGTIMSTPLVSGAVALILERQPDAPFGAITDTIMETSGPLTLSDPSLEGKLGAGEIDIDASISCNG